MSPEAQPLLDFLNSPLGIALGALVGDGVGLQLVCGVLWWQSGRDRRRWDRQEAARQRKWALREQLRDLEQQIREEQMSAEERAWHQEYRARQQEIRREAGACRRETQMRTLVQWLKRLWNTPVEFYGVDRPEPQAGQWQGLFLFVVLLMVMELLWLIRYLPERTSLVHLTSMS